MTLATKYRPQSFSEVVGQEHVKVILQNQIKSGDIKNAYLLTGGAGTGKTTDARIFAKEIGAEVIEIDGASNNGVDNVRELIESAKFRPINHKYKAFIIDEVHMLSTGAFNALLKTLEEPPAHAVFILATTDPQKIPATIMSRVQRFDFKRMTVEQIISRLTYIIESEEAIVATDAVEYIAKLAQGGMRSAISILDTCLGYIEKDWALSLESVMSVVGATPYEIYINLLYAKFEKNHERVLMIIEELHEDGKDLKQFIKGLMEFIVDIEKYSVLGDMRYVSAPAIYTNQIHDLGAKHDPMKLFKPLSELSNLIKYEQNPKTAIQGALLII